MKKIDTPATLEIIAPPTSLTFNPEEILTHLDTTLNSIDSLLKRMHETGTMVKKARNSALKHI
ncbi:hypothetical protein [Flexithrix dorotheae]|uniref:hypothetical protein n=1 Tax=Flexithrix dorotheae TaxID=70993 RepID=UPI0003779DBB|nr:hypothetical protein [Flexithrix dorotheae]